MESKAAKKILSEAFLLAVFCVAAGFFINLFHPKGFVFASKELIKSKNVTISAEEAK